MEESVFSGRLKEEKRLRLGIVRVEDERMRALSEFWSIMRSALRNPKSEKEVDRFDARITGMLTSTEERRIFEMLEREMKKAGEKREEEKAVEEKAALDIRRGEAEAFFAYASAGKAEQRIDGMREMVADVGRCTDAIRIIDANAERASAQQFARLIELAEKGEVRKEDVERELGKNRSPELAAAIYAILGRQEAASVAARNAMEMDRAGYERIFGIAAKNEAMAILSLYRRMLGDARFARAKEAALRGDIAGAVAQIRKLNIGAQYFFFSILAPLLMRSGMWNAEVLGIIFRALEAVKGAAVEAGRDPVKAQTDYMRGAKKFISRFADFRGLNLSLFSASFIASLR